MDNGIDRSEEHGRWADTALSAANSSTAELEEIMVWESFPWTFHIRTRNPRADPPDAGHACDGNLGCRAHICCGGKVLKE